MEIAAHGHIPVLPEETVSCAMPQTSGVCRVIDGTVGYGGHSSLILKKNPDAELLGIDRDETALAHAAERLAFAASRVRLTHGRFSTLAEKAAEELSKKYPGIRIAGTNDGYFKKEGAENDAVIEKINASDADVLFVCLGAPKQEKWIYDNREALKVNFAAGLGGTLDVFAGTVKRAPEFFIKANLEWFYRLLCMPSRLGRMMKLPKFLFGTMINKNKGYENK